MNKRYLLTAVFFQTTMALSLAQNVGIGTLNPTRLLHVEGESSQYARIRTAVSFSEAGLELTRGSQALSTTDWSLVNHIGHFKLFMSDDNFATREEALRLSSDGDLGLSTTPGSRLHLDDGEDASNTLDGYMIIGDKTGYNLVVDNNEIIARNNGSASPLLLQHAGGNIHLQTNGGTAYLATGNGDVGVNTSSLTAKFNVVGGGYQARLHNPASNGNPWYIGASAPGWQAGEDKLLFSPSISTSAAVLGLMNTPDNNGTTAPFMINPAGGQQLLMDGNEIDCISGALYINHNSNNNTYFNTQGGDVGIGTNNPSASLHIRTLDPIDPPLSLKRGGSNTWTVTPFTATGNLGFLKDGSILATVDDASGQWIAISDRRLKENIQPMYDVLGRLNELNLLTYAFKHDTASTPNHGILAQQVRELFPEIVNEQDGLLAVSYAQLSVIALKALQEQERQIEVLQARLTELRKRRK
ncbi:MAG: tail fiber domain-containing protein [Saprospiraceae bacterium]|nr:tail fiber domain-containing protein [Saprospiraceae bacterium]